jgi:hypothetical protein
MVHKLRPRSVYDVMAAIAFFIAVAGGSAYAAATIGSGDIKNDAVRSRHIKNGEVKNPDLGANSVGTGKVIDGSLLKQDFKAAQLPLGAQQFNDHVTNHTDGTQRSINGIVYRSTCNEVPTPNDVRWVVTSSSGTLYASGYYAQNGAITSFHTSSQIDVGATSTQDLNVIAMNPDVGKWTRFDLGSYNGGAAGCNVWGLITPPSQNAAVNRAAP